MKNISLAQKVYNWWLLQTLANILHRKFPTAASFAKTAPCGRIKCILFCVMHHQQNCHLSPDSRIFIVGSNLWSKHQNTAWFFRCQDELAFAKILFSLANWLYLSLKLWEGHKYEIPMSCESPTFILALKPLELGFVRKGWRSGSSLISLRFDHLCIHT